MTADDYIRAIVGAHRLPEAVEWDTEIGVVQPLTSIVRGWASQAGLPLCEVKLSGSRAKGTAIDLSSDLDLFISLSSSIGVPLRDIYYSLYSYLIHYGISARKQNVSIGVNYAGRKVDLVPAKRQNQYGSDHSLYRRKADTWTKTNIDTHIRNVKASNRQVEIVALKIWRERWKLEFPSIYLETFAIDSLKYYGYSNPANNFWNLLQDISMKITTQKIVDPANTNNYLSDELTWQEKEKLATQALISLSKHSWDEIIW